MSAEFKKPNKAERDGIGLGSAGGSPEIAATASRTDAEKYSRLLKKNPLPSSFAVLANSFALTSFKELMSDHRLEQENYAYSPLSLLYAIGMLIASSEEPAAKRIRLELQRCAGASAIDIDGLEQGFEALTAHVAANPYVVVEAANSVWLKGASDTRPQSNAAIDRLAQIFSAEALCAPFGSGEATEAICSWVSDKTHGKLKPMVKTSATMVAMLLNSLYAKMSWDDEFNPAGTDWGDFYKDEADKGDAKFMHAWLSDRHCLITDEYTRFTLPCKGGYSVDFLMPTGGEDFDGLSLESDWLESAFAAKDNRHANIELALPKFDIRSDLRLNELLHSLKMEGIFKPQDACPLVGGAFQVSQILQGVATTVDETGFEGAAYTVMFAVTGMPELPELETVDITFDHPFIFRVRTDEGIPLFMGCVADPTAPASERFFETEENDKLRRGKGNPSSRIASVHFSIGGFFGGYDNIDIAKSSTGGASCKTYRLCSSDPDEARTFELSKAEFDRLCIKLRDLGVFSWEDRYDDPGVLDGEEWQLEVEDIDGARFHVDGSNGYPKDFDKVYQLFVDAGMPQRSR